MYKQAARMKLRFSTPQGSLSPEQLWDLSLEQLDTLAVSLERKSKRAAKKTFLETRTEENVIDKLRFDIALDILTTKVDEQTAAQNAAETKAKRDQILGLLAKKRDEALEGKSEAELLAELDALETA